MSTSVQDLQAHVSHAPPPTSAPLASNEVCIPITGEDRYTPDIGSGLHSSAQIRAMRSEIFADPNVSGSSGGGARNDYRSQGAGWTAHAAFSQSCIASQPCNAKPTDLWYAQTAIASARVKQEQLTFRALRPKVAASA